jgi:predicted transcriptional regulator
MLNYVTNDLKTNYKTLDPKLFDLKSIEYLYLLGSNIYNKNVKDTTFRKFVKFENLKAFKRRCIRLLKHFIQIENKITIKLYQIFHVVLYLQLVSYIMKTQIIAKGIGLEHPTVKRVIEIAEEILNENNVLSVENLYNVAKRRLKIPKNGLYLIIQFLLAKKILIEGSKFSRETVLLNEIRRKIYRYINKNPGVHFSKIKNQALPGEMGSSGQLLWHLKLLINFNYIKKIKVGRYSVFLPSELDEEVGKIFFILRDRINRKIVNLLIKNETYSKSDIYKDIGEKREIVYYRINNLLNFDIITSNQDLEGELCVNTALREDVLTILETIKSTKTKIIFREE